MIWPSSGFLASFHVELDTSGRTSDDVGRWSPTDQLFVVDLKNVPSCSDCECRNRNTAHHRTILFFVDLSSLHASILHPLFDQHISRRFFYS
jgi:hypothetical protein